MNLVESITYRKLRFKTQSIKELYHILSADVRVYFSAINKAYLKYLIDILSGAKKVIDFNNEFKI